MHTNLSLYVALFAAFIDFIGIGLIYPLFSSMIFDFELPLLSPETTPETRGILLGTLLALSPLAQFFSAPVWGAFSDSKGRKTPLQISLALALLGYLTALCGVSANSIILLLASRVIIGAASGNMSIVQATIADVSVKENKAKNFGLFSMSIGAGFTLGPFIGGALSSWGYEVPFLFASLIVTCNLILILFLFKETHQRIFKRKLSWSLGFTQLKRAWDLQEVRAIFLCYFLHCFAWSFFFEFVSVYLISRFHFTSTLLGAFYGTAGGIYSLSTGLLIRPFVSRFKPELLFFAGNILTALAILSIPYFSTAFWIWPQILLVCFLVSFVAPTATTMVSNGTSSEMQGEALGILSSSNALALVLSPLFSISFVGIYPALSMWVSGSLLFITGLIVLAVFRKRIY